MEVANRFLWRAPLSKFLPYQGEIAVVSTTDYLFERPSVHKHPLYPKLFNEEEVPPP